MKTKLGRGVFIGAVGLVTSGLLACSLLVTRGETQCSGPDDTATCTNAFGPGARCSADGVCVSDGGAPEGGGVCATNRECIDRSGGEPAICRKDTKACVKLTNSDCSQVLAIGPGGAVVTDRRAVESDDTVVLGSLTSLFGANQAKGEARVNAFQLALQEFAARPLPIGGRTRPLAVLSCNDIDLNPPDGGQDPAVVRSGRHLAAVGVPAVVGGGNSATTAAALKELTAKGIVLIAPSATSPALTSNPDKMGLFFRTAPSDALQAIPLANLINEAEAAPPAGAKKLLLLSKGDSYGQGLRDQLVEKLAFGGKKISDPSNTAYKGLEYKTDAGFDFSALIAQTLSFEPQIIVIAGTNEGVDSLMKPIEAGWPAGRPRPQYIVSDGLKADRLTALVKDDEAASSPTSLRTRVRGTAPGRPNSVTNTFFLRYNSTFPAVASGSSTFGTAGAYDAAYLILYALGTVSGDAISGQTLTAGIRRVTKKGASGVDVGPNGIDTAKPFLTSGSDFDLNGASSPLDFDEAGESPADIEVWCVQRGAGGAAPSFFTTDKYFNAAANNVVGTFNCPGTGGDGGS